MAQKTSFIKMLTCMAGSNYSFLPGEVVEVDAKVAKDWIKAGIAEDYHGEVADKSLKAEIQSLRQQLEAAGEESEGLKAELEKAHTEIQSLTAELEALKKAADPPAVK